MTATTAISNARIIKMANEYSSLNSAEMRKTWHYLRSLADQIEANAVILDFSETTAIGAGFVHALEDFACRLEHRKVRLTLAGLNSNCAEVLRIASPNSRWWIFSSTSSAVRRLLGNRRPCLPMAAC